MRNASSKVDRKQLIENLRQQIFRQQNAPWSQRQSHASREKASSPLAKIFGAELLCGQTVELLGENGQGRTSFAAMIIGQHLNAMARAGDVVQICEGDLSFPLTWRVWGVPLDRLLIVRSTSNKNTLWAAEQSLKSRTVAAVFAPLGRVPSTQTLRLQRAAAAGQSLGVFIRPTALQRDACWTDFRLKFADCFPSDSVKSHGEFFTDTKTKLSPSPPHQKESSCLKQGHPPASSLSDCPSATKKWVANKFSKSGSQVSPLEQNWTVQLLYRRGMLTENSWWQVQYHNHAQIRINPTFPKAFSQSSYSCTLVSQLAHSTLSQQPQKLG